MVQATDHFQLVRPPVLHSRTFYQNQRESFYPAGYCWQEIHTFRSHFLGPGHPDPGPAHALIHHVHHSFHSHLRKAMVWMGLPADHLPGNGIQEGGVPD